MRRGGKTRRDKDALAHSGDQQNLPPSSYSVVPASPTKIDLEVQGREERGGSALPVISLVTLIGLFLSSVTGIVFFALGGLQSIIAHSNELPSRVVVLVACVIGALYTPIHAWAARLGYGKEGHGNYFHGAGLLLIRINLPIWITAIVTTALAAARIGLDVSEPFSVESSQTVYVNLLLSMTGLLSNFAMLCCIEWSTPPFATWLISKTELLEYREQSPSPDGLPSSEPPVEPPVSRYRSLNTKDRATGAWPAASQPAPAPLALPAPTVPPGTAISEAAPIAIPPIPVDDDGRSPVHMAWHPPSHHGRRPKSASVPSHSRAASVPTTRPRDPPVGDREPKLPDVFVMSHQDWRSIMASHSTPATPMASPRMTWAPRPSTSAASRPPKTSRPSEARRPSTSAGPPTAAPALAPPAEIFPERSRRQSMAKSMAPPVRFGARDAVVEKPVPAATPSAPSPKEPSPRAMPLRSHPPFGAPLIKPDLPKIAPPPIPPVLSRPAGDLPAERPRTAPGIPSASAGEWGVERKPVGDQATAVDERSSLSDYSTDEDDGGDEDEDEDGDQLYPAEENRSVMSRTARRVRKARARAMEEAVKRSQSVNRNFSRPLKRSRSLTSIRQQ